MKMETDKIMDETNSNSQPVSFTFFCLKKYNDLNIFRLKTKKKKKQKNQNRFCCLFAVFYCCLLNIHLL